MIKDKTIIAICYDFDKTLSPKDMQEYTLFPTLGEEASNFWKESNDLARNNKMDNILSYMYLIVKKLNNKADKLSIKKNDFKKMGKEVELFKGLDTWFERINDYGKSEDLIIEHYIISAGLKEIIQGTGISKYFTEIYASTFFYDARDIPVWPKQLVNHTQKTQYLFRISKNKLDLSDENSVNDVISKEKRRIPFENMIYIGDSDTDIPAMKVTRNQGGISIGVYDPNLGSLEKVKKLVLNRRIDFFAPADYSEGSILEKYVQNQIDKIKSNTLSMKINLNQHNLVKDVDKALQIAIDWDTVIQNTDKLDELKFVRTEILRQFRLIITRVSKEYEGEFYNTSDYIKSIEEYKNKILLSLDKKRKEIHKNNKKIKVFQK